MKFIISIIITLSAALCYADDLKPSDFKYGFKTDAPNQGDIYQLTVPAHVYENIENPDASDVAVFNANNELVPFVFMRPAPNGYKTPDNQSVPFFLLPNDNITEPAEIIIDLSALSQTPATMEFAFNNNKSFNTTANIYVSENDLNSWSRVMSSVNLAQLSSADNTIKQNFVQLPALPFSAKYLKLVLSGTVARGIATITVSFNPMPLYDSAEKFTVTGTFPAPERTSAVFDIKGSYPVEWVHFGMPESYLFPDFTVLVRDNNDEQWQTLRYRTRLAHYPVEPYVNGTGTYDTRKRYWNLTSDSVLSADNNTATFYWRADELVFMAKGPGPYVVAYGKEGFTPTHAMLSAGSALIQASAHALRANSDNTPESIYVARPEAPVEHESNMKKYILIGVTLLVVLALTFAAFRLIMDINRKNN